MNILFLVFFIFLLVWNSRERISFSRIHSVLFIKVDRNFLEVNTDFEHRQNHFYFHLIFFRFQLFLFFVLVGKYIELRWFFLAILLFVRMLSALSEYNKLITITLDSIIFQQHIVHNRISIFIYSIRTYVRDAANDISALYILVCLRFNSKDHDL